MALSTAILRADPGACIRHSGISTLGMDAGTAEALRGMAAQGVPVLGKLTPEQFAKFISYGEIAVGASLLLPFVPTKVAGLALAGFSGSLVSMYLRTPGMTESDGVRPTQQGTAVAKDTWLLAIAAALVLAGGKGKGAKTAE